MLLFQLSLHINSTQRLYAPFCSNTPKGSHMGSVEILGDALETVSFLQMVVGEQLWVHEEHGKNRRD